MRMPYKKSQSLLVLLGTYALTAQVSAISVVQQSNIIMQRTGQCEQGEGIVGSDGSVQDNCSVQFSDPTFTASSSARGTITAENIRFLNGLSGRTISSETMAPFQRAKYSLTASGTINQLNYTSAPTQVAGPTSHPEGYYAIQDSIGLYWTAYLRYNDNTLTWGAVDNPQNPWQSCNASDNFSRELGCGFSAGNIGDGNSDDGNIGDGNSDDGNSDDGNSSGGGNIGGGKSYNSIFDGAGSIVYSQEVCYGCDKDLAAMQPHFNETSTVVFQWRYDAQKCVALNIQSSIDALPVLIQAKAWNDASAQKAFKTTLSNQQPFYLESVSEWTTFSVTSLSPLISGSRISIGARCVTANDTRLPSVNAQAVSPSPILVDNNTEWKGTGSIISSVNKRDYGLKYDLTVGSSTGNALSSFQWYTSQGCSNLDIVDNSNSNAIHAANVSIKEWSAERFTEICSTIPCTINKAADVYYVIKVESSASEFSNEILARCQ